MATKDNAWNFIDYTEIESAIINAGRTPVRISSWNPDFFQLTELNSTIGAEIYKNHSYHDNTEYLYNDDPAIHVLREALCTNFFVNNSACITSDNLLLCPGSTSGLALIMLFLKQVELEFMFFITPLYFSVIRLCKFLSIPHQLIATEFEGRYTPSKQLLSKMKACKRKKALFLTHPKYCTGINIIESEFISYIDTLNNGDFLILDETLDLDIPCKVDRFLQNYIDPSIQIIRLKSFFKPIQLNAYRLSYIIHPTNLMKPFESCVDVLYGGLDLFSVESWNSFLLNENSLNLYSEAIYQLKYIMTDNYQKLSIIAEAMGVYLVGPWENGVFATIILPRRSGNHYFSRDSLCQFMKKTGFVFYTGEDFHFKDEMKFLNIRINLLHGIEKTINFIESYLSFFKLSNNAGEKKYYF